MTIGIRDAVQMYLGSKWVQIEAPAHINLQNEDMGSIWSGLHRPEPKQPQIVPSIE